MAACSCYGHDIDCQQSNVTGQYECVCGENTMGEYCDLCKPFYNQQDFMSDIPCERKFKHPKPVLPITPSVQHTLFFNLLSTMHFDQYLETFWENS